MPPCARNFIPLLADKAWQRHKERVLLYCPTLASVFDAHGQETDGKRVLQSKRQKQTPQGTWYIFARFLMRNPYTLAFERRKSKFAQAMTSAVVEASVLCLYYPERRERHNPWNNHCVDYTIKKLLFIRVNVHGSHSISLLSDWMATHMRIVRYSQVPNVDVQISVQIMARPFLAIVHDELENFPNFTRAIFQAIK